jgi:hypothetical protein
MTSLLFKGNNFKSNNWILDTITLVFSVSTAVLYLHSVLTSQSGKEERREQYDRKKNNQSKSDRKKAKNLQTKLKKIADNKVHRKKHLQSQSGTVHSSSYYLEHTYSLLQEVSVDALSKVWFFLNTLPTKSNDLNTFITTTYNKTKSLVSELEIPTEFIQKFDFSSYVNAIKYIRTCKLMTDFYTILNMLTTLGWLKSIELKCSEVVFFKSESLRKTITLPDLLTAFISFLKTLIKCLLKYPSKGFLAFYEDAIKGTYEEDYTFLVSSKVLIDTGRSEIDPKLYDRKLSEMITLTGELISSCDAFEKAYYVSKLKELKALMSSRTLAQRDFIRMKPYGLLAYGGSAVGKTAISNALIRYILKVNNFDSSPKSIITLNEFDKFQSEYRTHHGGVIFDDLCNGTVDHTDGNPLMKIIQFINNSPQAALNPNVEMKGNVMIEPNVVLATTNVKNLMASYYTNEPLSIARRFNVTITQSVKPEYCIAGTSMIDETKVRAAFGSDPYPNFALFTVERALSSTGNIMRKNVVQTVHYVPVDFEGKQLIDIEINTLLKFLKEDSQKHFSNQANFVASQRKNADIELCEHMLPVGNCSKCIFESQAADLTYVLDGIKSIEEKIVSYCESVMYDFLNTKFGRLLLMYLYRDVLKSIVLGIAPFYALLCLNCLLLEHLGVLPGLTYFIVLTVIIVGVVGIRFYLARKRVLKKWCTFPRPTVYFLSLSFVNQMKIISLIGGATTLALLKKFFMWRNKLPTAQAADPITLRSSGVPVKTKEFWDEREIEKNFSFNPQIENTGRCITLDQLKQKVSKRLMMVHIGKPGEAHFCNCVSLRGNLVLLPNHIVPKTTTEAKITMEGAHINNCVISPESCYHIPGTDFAIWYLPELGDRRDLLQHFPTNITKGKQYVGSLIYNDHGLIKRFPDMLATRSKTTTSEGGRFESLVYSFPGETFNGLCMATFVATDSKGLPFIGGFHLGGRGSAGAAGFITKEQIEMGIEQISKRSSVLVSHTGSNFRTNIAGIEVGPLTAPHSLCVSNDLKPDAKCTVFGTHNQPRATATSAVVTSIISGAVAEHTGLIKIHGQPYKMGDRMHKEVDIAGKTDTAYKFNGASVEKAVIDYKTSIIGGLTQKDLAKVGKLGNDANLAGFDGVQGINAMAFTTSCGFPFKGPKTSMVSKSDRFVDGIDCPRDVDPIILDEMKELETILLRGERINTVFKAALKDEPTKYTKKKVRVFAGSNFPFTMLVRKYFLTMSALMQEKKELFECAVGINVESPEWTKLMKHVYVHGENRVVAGDYKAFDGRMSPRFMLAAFKILIDIAKASGNFDEDDLIIMRGIATEICSPTYDFFGTLIQFYGSNPSGHPLTVVINSMVNSLYMRYCYYEIAKEEKWFRIPRFNKIVSLITYGDDNIMSVKSGYDAYNHTNIARMLAMSGIVYTMADKEAESIPFIEGKDAGFLKHNAVWDDYLGLYRAVIDESSIAKMLHAHKKSSVLSEEMHAACSIKDVMDKYAHFGREKYEERREQLTAVARDAGILGLVGEIKTYEEQLDEYCSKYDWENNPRPSAVE